MPDLSDEVRQFISAQALGSDLDAFIRAAGETFPEAESLEVTKERDPDADDVGWIAVALTVRGSVEGVLKAYDDFVGKIVREIPEPKRGLIRLSLNID